MRLATRLAAATLPFLWLVAPARARAAEVTVKGQPLLIDITNTAILNYHFNNRNTDPKNVGTLLDDQYGEWLDRFNTELTWWRFRLGFRIDGATYAFTPNLKGVDALVEDLGKDSDYRNQILRELHTRYLTTFYPSKLFIGYVQPGVEVTIGDFYAQLGRGLVFSARKIDELAVDTTVRGAKVTAERDFGAFHLGGTLFVGQMNPLRVDETSGRRLNGAGSALFFGFPRASDLETIGRQRVGGILVTDPKTGKTHVEGGEWVSVPTTQRAQPNYLEDTVLGARVEGGPKFMTIAANASVLARRSQAEDLPDFSSTDPAKKRNQIITYSGSINVPSIAKHGDIYAEVAGQKLAGGRTADVADLSGYAAYLSGSITGGPVSFSLEGKHYRSFASLTGNIDTTTQGFYAPEHNLIAYNQPPTAEPIYTEPVSGAAPNLCITGGRGRLDYRYHRDASVYAWLGHYASWSEIDATNETCKIDKSLQTNTWDTAVGTDLGLEKSASHVRAWIGVRTTDRSVAADLLNSGLTETFYREGYIRYDIVKHLSGPFSLQLQGFHRHRFEPVSFAKAWTEGENYTALQWSPHFSAIFGYEYQAKQGCQAAVAATRTRDAIPQKDVCHFVNGGLQWRSHGKGGALGVIFDTVNIFVGQRRGALRCVSGVCRQFPPFEGAKLELTSRF